MKLSNMAENLIGSEIIKLAGEVNERIAKGQKIYNFTIGDFDPKLFPIPAKMNTYIQEAYQAQETNYPAGNGIAPLRNAISKYISHYQGLNYKAEEILVSGGARPLIYALYRTIVDKGDKVIFPVPSWNNNHYCHLSGAEAIMLEVNAEDNFMPKAKHIAPYIKEAVLVSLCSPLNPTGTVFTKESLLEICELILSENKRREAENPNAKPIYLMYDQIYNMLTFDGVQHFDPVSLMPEMRNYTVFIDGISKAFAATGVRIGWGFGPSALIGKMQSILSHVGAWPPKAEQVACSKYLADFAAIDTYLVDIKTAVYDRLKAIYTGFKNLKEKGYKVDAITPQGAIYLTIQFDLLGMKNQNTTLNTTADITAFLLEEVGLAIVPFYAFGADKNSTWYRLSVGTCPIDEIAPMFEKLEAALATFKA